MVCKGVIRDVNIYLSAQSSLQSGFFSLVLRSKSNQDRFIGKRLNRFVQETEPIETSLILKTIR